MEIMTGIKDMKNNVRKERRASLQLRSRDVKSGMNKGGYKMKKGGKENRIENRMAKILVYHEKSGIIKAREN